MWEWASSNGAGLRPRSGWQKLQRAQTNQSCKEYSDDHQSNSEILQCDNDEASVESEESYSEELLNLGRVFETSNENAFLIGHSSSK